MPLNGNYVQKWLKPQIFWSWNASKDSSLQKIKQSVKNINIINNCRKEHGNFHVPSDKLVERNCRKEHGNFHVLYDQVG